jgi:hypothetical protein
MNGPFLREEQCGKSCSGPVVSAGSVAAESLLPSAFGVVVDGGWLVGFWMSFYD